jgi:hypothetical protein
MPFGRNARKPVRHRKSLIINQASVRAADDFVSRPVNKLIWPPGARALVVTIEALTPNS